MGFLFGSPSSNADAAQQYAGNAVSGLNTQTGSNIGGMELAQNPIIAQLIGNAAINPANFTGVAAPSLSSIFGASGLGSQPGLSYQPSNYYLQALQYAQNQLAPLVGGGSSGGGSSSSNPLGLTSAQQAGLANLIQQSLTGVASKSGASTGDIASTLKSLMVANGYSPAQADAAYNAVSNWGGQHPGGGFVQQESQGLGGLTPFVSAIQGILGGAGLTYAAGSQPSANAGLGAYGTMLQNGGAGFSAPSGYGTIPPTGGPIGANGLPTMQRYAAPPSAPSFGRAMAA